MKNSLEVLAGTSPKITFQTFRESSDKIKTLESALGLPPGKPIFNIRAAAARVAELETLVAAVNTPPPVPIVSAPAMPAAPVMEKFGRERFLASRQVAAVAKVQIDPALTGRARFAAACRVDGTPHILTGNPIPAALDENDAEKKKLTGRERFNASIAKDFAANKK
jgi:hypothetical protein